MVKKLLRKLKNLQDDLNNAVNTVSKIPTFLEDAAKDTGKKFVNFIKTPVDEIEECFGELDDIIMDTVRELEKWPRTIGDGLRKIFNAINNAFKDLELFFKNLFKVCIEIDGVTICYGINNMIEDFKRIVCMLETIPNRVDNIIVGIDNIFLGIGHFFKQLKVSGGEVGKEVQTLADYNFLYFGRWLACFIKFAQNFFKCFVYYLIDFVGKLLYLPVSLGIWIMFTFLGIDLYPHESRVFEGLNALDAFLYGIIGFSILHYPKHIRQDCYSCIRLRPQVIRYQAKQVGKTFRAQGDKFTDDGAEKRKNPNGEKHVITDNNNKLATAYNNFKEVTAFPEARPARKVESDWRSW